MRFHKQWIKCQRGGKFVSNNINKSPGKGVVPVPGSSLPSYGSSGPTETEFSRCYGSFVFQTWQPTIIASTVLSRLGVILAALSASCQPRCIDGYCMLKFLPQSAVVSRRQLCSISLLRYERSTIFRCYICPSFELTT